MLGKRVEFKMIYYVYYCINIEASESFEILFCIVLQVREVLFQHLTEFYNILQYSAATSALHQIFD